MTYARSTFRHPALPKDELIYTAEERQHLAGKSCEAR